MKRAMKCTTAALRIKVYQCIYRKTRSVRDCAKSIGAKYRTVWDHVQSLAEDKRIAAVKDTWPIQYRINK